MKELILEEVQLRIKEIVIELLQLDKKPEEINNEDNLFLEDYGYNSIDALELLLKIENEFEISIPDEDLNSELVKSVETLTNYVMIQVETQSSQCL